MIFGYCNPSFVMRADRAAVGAEHTCVLSWPLYSCVLSSHRPQPVSRRPPRNRQRVLRACGKNRLSDRLIELVTKLGNRVYFLDTAKPLVAVINFRRRCLHVKQATVGQRPFMRIWTLSPNTTYAREVAAAIIRTISSESWAVLTCSGKRHWQLPLRPLSHAEASGHPRRLGPRSRSAQHGGSDHRGH
jgi:hypothetical protein